MPESMLFEEIVLAQILIIAGASIVGALGWVHLLLIFFSQKFHAHNPDVTEAMKNTSPIISKQTSMWHAWVGFNASHGIGALLLAAVYIPLTIYHFPIINHSLWFSLLPCLISLSYLILAKKYWFNVPFSGLLISSICFMTAFIII